ncbi:N-acetylmuramoyl-L-alanine amidase [Hyphococcus lacteus]|uniref:N-acetylmuramoyl-L-alanine amidase n=1 Tax=Hyphococcus lacteus TaxID=3143536 RepID=A0ABV3Z516_9PROT
MALVIEFMKTFMCFRKTIRCVAGFVVFATAVLSGAHAVELKDVRFGPSKDTTRIVFDIQGAPTYAVSGDEVGEGRLYVNFESLSLGSVNAAFKPGKGHVARYGFALQGKNGTRAVFEFNKTAKIKEVFVLEPKGKVSHYRLVVDLQTADKAAFLASLPSVYGDIGAVIEQVIADNETPPKQDARTVAATASLKVPPTPTLKNQPDAKSRTAAEGTPKLKIVIDPGHGGRDPGAIGPGGTLEKTVTLAAALELSKILEERGNYDVILTREADKDPKIKRDQREELARREALARAAGGQLFISLHADAVAQPDLRGASVYTLSNEGSARSASLAKSEGNYHSYGLELKKFDPVLGGILLDKAQDTTLTQSSKFAEILIGNLSGKTPLLNRSHRKGDLRVLLATDVPAVLLEMAFISNSKDESNLKSKSWRKRTMTAVADSIDDYFTGEHVQRHAGLPKGAAK